MPLVGGRRGQTLTNLAGDAMPAPAYRHAKDTACTTFVYQERARTSRIELIVLCPTNVDANGIVWQSFHFTTKDRLLLGLAVR